MPKQKRYFKDLIPNRKLKRKFKQNKYIVKNKCLRQFPDCPKKGFNKICKKCIFYNSNKDNKKKPKLNLKLILRLKNQDFI